MTNGIRYGYADTPEGQVHYREAGSGPAVVLLHETPLSGATYEWALPLLAPLRPGHRPRHPRLRIVAARRTRRFRSRSTRAASA